MIGYLTHGLQSVDLKKPMELYTAHPAKFNSINGTSVLKGVEVVVNQNFLKIKRSPGGIWVQEQKCVF
jgi:hypothetical protein